jgi:hypothetical protein
MQLSCVTMQDPQNPKTNVSQGFLEKSTCNQSYAF